MAESFSFPSGDDPYRDILREALYYASQLSWKVFPTHQPVASFQCSCGNPDCGRNTGKHPRVAHGLNDATADLVQIQQWFAKWPHSNIAIRTGLASGIVVADFDGAAGLKILQSHPGINTPTVRTGSGGRHLFFKATGALPSCAPILPRLPGLDLRADGGYVVAAPSIAASYDNRYEWLIHPRDVPLADLPPWLVAIIAERASKGVGGRITISAAQKAAVETSPLDQRIKMARQYLNKYVRQVQNKGYRDNTGTALSLQLRDLALPLDTAERIILEYQAAAAPYGDPRDPYTPQKALITLHGIYETEQREPPTPLPPENIPLYTDEGNADRLITAYGDDIRYCAALQRWYINDGIRWYEEDQDTTHLSQMFSNVIRRFERAEMERIGPLGDEAKPLLRHVHYSQGINGHNAAIKMAARKAAIQISSDDFDSHPYLFNVLNGTIELRSGELRPHRREDYLTNVVDIEYDPNAEPIPEWQQTLDIFLPDKEVQLFYQKCWGYSILGKSPDYVFFGYGDTKTGKTTITRAIMSTIGSYGRYMDTNTLLRSVNTSPGSPRADLLKLVGARAVWADENNEGATVSEQLIKQLTGGDYLTARPLYGKTEISFLNTATLWFTFNHWPKVNYEDEAMWQRIIVFPFERYMDVSERNTEMRDRLSNRAYAGSTILRWLIEGVQMYLQDPRLTPTSQVRRAAEEYRDEMNPVVHFLEESVEYEHSATTGSSDLHAAYIMWCRKHNHRGSQPNIITFGRSVSKFFKDAGADVEKIAHKHGRQAWRGIRLINEVNISVHDSRYA